MASQFASTSQSMAYNGGATANVYGPALSRTRASDAESIAQVRADYDAHMTAMSQQQDAANQSATAADWNRTNGAQAARSAFYNTRQGDGLIAAARTDLARSTGAASFSSTQPSHNDCLLPQNIAQDAPKTRAVFQQYPLCEFNRFSAEARAHTGPEIHSRLKSVPYSSPKGPKELDVLRRYDVVANLKKNQSTSNYNHDRPFLAKHTNNLIDS